MKINNSEICLQRLKYFEAIQDKERVAPFRIESYTQI